MKPTIKGEHATIGYVVKDLFPVPLNDKDKVAFHSHVVEIEKMRDLGYPWNEWEWRKQIIENFCKRTKVNMRVLLKYINGKYWLRIFNHLIEVKAI